MATSTPTSTPMPEPTPAAAAAPDVKTIEARRRRHKRWKQVQIWLPQLIATLIFCLLLPCSHLFPFSDQPWPSVMPSLLNFSEIGSVTASPFVVNSVMYVSVFATVILIFVGTAQFLGEARSPHSDGYATVAYWLTFGSLLLVVFWAFSILTTDQRLWVIPRLGVEGWSLLVFIVFAAIDGLYWFSFRKKIGSKQGDEKTSVELKKQFSANSFWFIDVPVIIGVVSVLLLTIYMAGEPVYRDLTKTGEDFFKENPIKETHREAIFEIFLHGFSTGAIVMHMAFSQFIFGLLKTKDLNERFERKLENDLFV